MEKYYLSYGKWVPFKLYPDSTSLQVEIYQLYLMKFRLILMSANADPLILGIFVRKKWNFVLVKWIRAQTEECAYNKLFRIGNLLISETL